MAAELAVVVQAGLGVPVTGAPLALRIGERVGGAVLDVHFLAVLDGRHIGDAGAVAVLPVLLQGVLGIVGALDLEVEALGDEAQVQLVLEVQVEDALLLLHVAQVVKAAETVVGLLQAGEVRVGEEPAPLLVQAVAGHRRGVVQIAEELGLAAADDVSALEASADAHRQRGTLGEVEVDVRAVVVPAVFEVLLRVGVEGLEQTVLVEGAGGHIVAAALVAARGGNVHLLLPRIGLQDGAEPVGVRIDLGHVVVLEVLDGLLAEPELVRGGAVAELGVVEGRRIGVGVHHLEEVGDILDTGRGVGADPGLSFLAALGGDEDDAVRAAHAVHGRGGGVLQDGDVLDVVRVDLPEGAFDTVHEHQRLGAVQGADTADADDRFVVTRQTRVLDGLDARQPAGEGVAQGSDRRLDDVVAADIGDGAGDGHLLLGAIGHDDHFVEIPGIGLHPDPHLAGHGHLLGRITDVGDDQRRIRTDRAELERTVEIRHRAGRGAFHQDRHADQRLAGFVFNHAFDADSLGEGEGWYQV